MVKWLTERALDSPVEIKDIQNSDQQPKRMEHVLTVSGG